MKFKNKLKLACLCLLLFNLNNSLAMDDCLFMDDSDLFGDMGDIGEDDIFGNPDVDNFLKSNKFNINRKITPKDIIQALVEIDAIKLLEETFFLSTAPLNKRNLVTYPLFLCDKEYKFKWDIGVNIFYNQTSRIYFSQDSSCVFCYLGLLQQSLINKIVCSIEKIEEIFGQDFDFDLVGSLCLFKNATCQERRVGVMLQGLSSYRDVNFHFKFPFYWRERNYYQTSAEREAIERELGALDPDNQQRFQADHMISDRLGFGDFRFEVDFPIGEYKRGFSWRAGFLTTLPVNISIIDSLMGSVYHKRKCRPTFSFLDLFEWARDPTTRCLVEKLVGDFFLCALDGISNTFLDTTLGRGRHLGLGLVMRSKIPFDALIKKAWAKKFFYKGNITFEYLLPCTPWRYFIECPDPQAFADRHFEDYDDEELIDEITGARARDDLEFLEQKFVDKFYPFVYQTKVKPGVELTWVNKVSYESRGFCFHLGTDFWVKSGEKLSNVCASRDKLKKLDFCKATRRFAYQWRGLGEFIFKVKRPTKDLFLSLNIDGAFVSKGIGKDFMITFNIESNF